MKANNEGIFSFGNNSLSIVSSKKYDGINIGFDFIVTEKNDEKHNNTIEVNGDKHNAKDIGDTVEEYDPVSLLNQVLEQNMLLQQQNTSY